MYKKIVTAGVLLAASLTAVAANQSPISASLEGNSAIIPMQGVVVGERGGRSAIFSPNGRYEVKGYILDNWTGREIRTVADARLSIDYVDFKALKLDMSDLGAMRVGTGPKAVQIFMDPLCAPCRQLLNEQKAHRHTPSP